MRGARAQQIVALGTHVIQVHAVIDHAMEGDAVIDAGPVLRVAAPGGEIAPAGLAAVQHPFAHVAGRGLHAGGAHHLLHGHGVFAVFVQAVDDGHLVAHVHGDGVGHGRGHGRGPRGRADVQHVAAVEEHVPGFLVGFTRDEHAVVLLERLHGRNGLVHVVAADRAGEEAQLRQAGLHLLDLLALGAALQLMAAVFAGAQAVGRAGAVLHHHHVVDVAEVRVRVRRGRGLRALGQRRIAEEQALRLQIRLAGRLHAHGLLKSRHGLLRGRAVHAGGIGVQIAQLAQHGLQALHVLAVVAVAQGAVLGLFQHFGAFGVQLAGRFQAIVLLKALHAVLRSLQKIAADAAHIVAQLAQPALQLAHRFALIAVFERGRRLGGRRGRRGRAGGRRRIRRRRGGRRRQGRSRSHGFRTPGLHGSNGLPRAERDGHLRLRKRGRNLRRHGQRKQQGRQTSSNSFHLSVSFPGHK